MPRRAILLSVCCAAMVAILGRAEPDAAPRGRVSYEKRCTGCHTLDGIKVGPPLRGIVGRRAASDPRFPYSEALKSRRFVWDETSLDRWLADPDDLVPGNDMPFRLDDPAERSAIVAYLKQLPARR